MSSSATQYNIVTIAVALCALAFIALIGFLIWNGSVSALEYQQKVTERIKVCLDAGSSASECKLAFDNQRN